MPQASEQLIAKCMENVFVLRQIDKLPIDFEQALFQHYPAMKLGSDKDVVFYARRLAQLTKDRIQVNDAEDWVVTAPPYYNLPAAANLLARKVSQELGASGFINELIEPRLAPVTFNTKAEFDLYYNYSKNNLQQRIAERERLQHSLETDNLRAQLSGKSLMVINDINVTGTQQHFMQKAFNHLGVKQCHWLYIFNLDPQLASKNPEIEHQINHCQVNTLESFASILEQDDVDFTARCLSRLFNEEFDAFSKVLSFLNPQTCWRIYNLALLEKRYDGDFFAKKMAMLATCSSPAKQVINREPGATHVRY